MACKKQITPIHRWRVQGPVYMIDIILRQKVIEDLTAELNHYRMLSTLRSWNGLEWLLALQD